MIVTTVELTPTKSPDIFIPGNIVSSKSKPDHILMVTDKPNNSSLDDRYFAAVILKSGYPNTDPVGQHSDGFDKSAYQQFGGSITLTYQP